MVLAEDDTDEPTLSAFGEDGRLSVSEQRLNAYGEALWAVYDLREIWRNIGPRVQQVIKGDTLGRNDPAAASAARSTRSAAGLEVFASKPRRLRWTLWTRSRTLLHICRHLAAGHARYAHELQCPGLRAWSLKRYPYIVFYVERPECVDVWRVLHSERDIPAWLREPGAE